MAATLHVAKVFVNFGVTYPGPFVVLLPREGGRLNWIESVPSDEAFDLLHAFTPTERAVYFHTDPRTKLPVKVVSDFPDMVRDFPDIPALAHVLAAFAAAKRVPCLMGPGDEAFSSHVTRVKQINCGPAEN